MGDNVTLGCTLEGADIGTWYYNNVPMEQATVTSEDDRTSALVQLEIRSVQMAQGGWYTCAASTDTERMERDFLLVIGGESKLEWLLLLHFPPSSSPPPPLLPSFLFPPVPTPLTCTLPFFVMSKYSYLLHGFVVESTPQHW